MKKLLLLFILFFQLNLFTQVNSNWKLDSLIDNQYNKITGTCASPNGNMNSIVSPPPSYAWLQTNGYCHPSALYNNSGTVCWNFTPTSTSITINSGYSSTGCAFISFGPFNLYRCSPSCLFVGSGLSFSVTAGQCYTWCMGYSGLGGGCTFNDFCPYYQQFIVLPIELSYFAGSNQNNINILQWKTETEINNKYFILEISNDAENWDEFVKINSLGNSNKSQIYTYQHKNYSNIMNYYRLKQVDFDNSFKHYGIVVVNNLKNDNIKPIRIINILGQEVSENYQGIKILYYSDGSVIKQN